jgi:PEP-CTERM motif-containing protein
MKASRKLVMKMVTGLAALALVLLVAAPASAAVLQIQFSGLNLTYTGGAGGGQLCDSTTCNGGGGVQAQSDPLITVTMLLDGNLVGNVLVSNIWADVSTLVSAGIPVGGGSVPTSGGIFDILTNNGSPGWGLALNLSDGQLTYNNGTLSFVGSANVAAIFSQNLPFGLVIGMPIDVAYSINNLQITSAGGFLTSAFGAGTGEIVGQQAVPEPASILLLGSGLAFAARQVRRRRAGK